MRTALRLGVLVGVICVTGARAEDKPAKPPEGFTNLFDGKSLVRVDTGANGLVIDASIAPQAKVRAA